MSGDNVPDRGRDSPSMNARNRIDELQHQVPPGNPLVSERLSTVRARVNEYEQAESKPEEENVVQRIEDELDDLRDAIEEELEEGKQEAHDLVDDIEERVAKFRD